MYIDIFDLPFNEKTKDIVCEKNGNGDKHYNFKHSIIRHSPSGMEWGFCGSGPADFAINALLKVTESSTIATNPVIYQDFKRHFVAVLPKEGGTIKGDDIIAWLALKNIKIGD